MHHVSLQQQLRDGLSWLVSANQYGYGAAILPERPAVMDGTAPQGDGRTYKSGAISMKAYSPRGRAAASK